MKQFINCSFHYIQKVMMFSFAIRKSSDVSTRGRQTRSGEFDTDESYRLLSEFSNDPDSSRRRSLYRYTHPVPHNHKECERIFINVSGLVFETQLRTLNRFPDTLLGDPSRRIRYFIAHKNEYFFDRYRPCFEAILYFYQSGGVLRRPVNVPLDIFSEEIQFWELGEEAIAKFRKDEGFIMPEEHPLPKNLFQRKIWLLFEDPHSSFEAKVMAFISICVIMISIAAFCIETKPQFRRYKLHQIANNMTLVEEDEVPDLTDPFFLLETMCIVWFSMEFLLRAFSCPNKVAFMFDFMNFIDLMAIIPYFFTLATIIATDIKEKKPMNINVNSEEDDEGNSLALFKLIKLFRVFRIFKLARHSTGLRVILRTFKASFKELGLLLFFLSIGSVLFSSAAYLAELSFEESHFRSIPHGCYWALVTMTTVGYGDMFPIGFWGKIIGTMCVLAGVLTIALPVPFIESNFTYFYNLENRLEEMQSKNENHVPSCPYQPAPFGQSNRTSSTSNIIKNLKEADLSLLENCSPRCNKTHKLEVPTINIVDQIITSLN